MRKNSENTLNVPDEKMLMLREMGVEQLRNELINIYDRSERVRKSMYAKHGSLEKKYSDLETDLKYIKSAICKE